MEPEVVLKYRSGEEIKKGDRVLHHGEPGEIELVALELGDPETDWYVQEYGGGIMIEDAIFGHPSFQQINWTTRRFGVRVSGSGYRHISCSYSQSPHQQPPCARYIFSDNLIVRGAEPSACD